MSADKINRIAVSSGRWFKRLGWTLTTGAIITGFYSIYAMVLRPLVDPPGLNRPSVANDSVWAPPRPRQGEEMAKRYLVSQPWAAKAKYILRTEEAFIYFEEWDPIDDDKAVRFTPFAMVWTKKDRKPDEEPTTIISDSAYVRFVRKFKLHSPDAGRVIGGALEGNVHIEGDKGMQIVSRNFAFSEESMKLWCNSHVDFAYGPHKGNGHGMQIELIPDEVARAKDKLAVKGFKTVRLRRDVSMDLEFQDRASQNLVAQAEPANPIEEPKPSPKPEKPKPPTIVKVRSSGSFEYVIETHLATFEDEVRVYQPTEPGKYNSLQADLMTLYFERKEKPKPNQPPNPGPLAVKTVAFETTEEASPPKKDEEFQSIGSNLTFRRLVAVGQNVILRSETNDLIAMMHHLDYDAKSRLAKLTSRNTVRVLQKQSEMHSPTIELLQEKGGGQVSHFWAKGAGWMKSLDEKTQKLTFAAQWKKELRKLPDPRTGLDMIELESEALVRQPEDQFGLAADFIRLWLERREKPTEDSAQVNNPESDPTSGSMQPKRLLAIKDVAIINPDMQGQTQRLEVWFEPAPLSQRIPAPAPMIMSQGNGPQRSRNVLTPAVKQVRVNNSPTVQTPQVVETALEGSSVEIPLAPPASNPESQRPDEAEKTGEAKPKDGPIEVVADLIRVKVLTYPGKQKSSVSEVWTEGHVQVQQQHVSGEPPLQMTGDRLHVKNRAKDDQIVTLWGTPAHVRDRGMHIEGREVFLDRTKNQSRVNGAGLLQLPVKRSLEGEVLKEPKLLDIWWTEQMTFDGLNAKFFGNVRTVMNNDGLRSNMRCEEMDVVLSKKVSFTESRSSQNRDPKAEGESTAEVARVFCKDGVEFDSYKYEESKLSEVRRGRFAEFAINQTTGDTSGQGPGWIKVWRRGRGKRASMTPNATVKANRALKPDSADWEYMRIDFAGTADGNLKQKFNTFKDRVQIIYGPVERSLMVVKLDELPKDAGWMRSQNLRITHHEPLKKEETGYIDLLATGNVELEGRSFNARADSISYDESKGLYTLRSQGRQKATIWRQTQLGGDLSRADAQLMHFIPAKNILKLDQAIGLDGVN